MTQQPTDKFTRAKVIIIIIIFVLFFFFLNIILMGELLI